VVEDEEAAAPYAGGERLGDPQRGGCGDRRVDRIPTLPEHLQPDPRGVGVDCGDSPAKANGGRLFDEAMLGHRGRGGQHGHGHRQHCAHQQSPQPLDKHLRAFRVPGADHPILARKSVTTARFGLTSG
jgi:hypothetical protein